MADANAETTLAVEVQGAEAVNALAAALGNLNRQAAQVQRTVSAAGPQTATATATRQAAAITAAAAAEAGTLGERIAYRIGRAIGATIRAPFDALRATASVAGRSLLSLSGTFGQLASSAGATSVAIVGVGLAIAGLGIPILNLVAGFKLLRSSFGWAQEAADEQIRIAGRTQRFYPQLIGEGIEAAEDEMRARMGVATALFGNAAESIQQQVTRRFTEFRMGRGLRGERDLFARWGITPQSVATAEQMMGRRFDVTSWLEAFILKREDLQRRLQEAQSPQERTVLTRKLAQMSDDTVKMFGQRFSDMVNVLSTGDAARLKRNMEAAIPLGRVVETSEQAKRRAVNFKVALESVKATFTNIARGIGGDVQPVITRFLTELNRKMLDTDQGGEGLGRAFRELASAMAVRAWEELRNIMRRIDTQRVKGWIEAIKSWNPAETVETVKTVFNALQTFGSAVSGMIDSVNAFLQSLPEWLKRRLGIKPPSFNERFGQWPGGGRASAEEAEAGAAGAAGATELAPAPALPEGYTRGTIPRSMAPQFPGAGAGGAAVGAPAPPSTFGERFGTWPRAEGPAALGAAAAGAPAPTATAPPPVEAGPTPPAAAASGAPAPGPVTPAPAPEEPAAQDRGWLGRLRRWFSPTAAHAAEAPPTPERNAAIEAMQGAAAGSALGMMTNVESTPTGDQLVMKASYTGEQGAARPEIGWKQALGPAMYGAGAAAELAGLPGFSVGQGVARAVTKEGAGVGEVMRGAIPGMGMLEFMKRDAEQGHPTRTYLREMLGIPDPGEPAPWQQQRGVAEELTAPFNDRFGTWGTSSITAEDGYNFGEAAATSLREGLEGVHIPAGHAVTSSGVAPRTAPKPTGGDTATEA